jgi:hypothetical protein
MDPAMRKAMLSKLVLHARLTLTRWSSLETAIVALAVASVAVISWLTWQSHVLQGEQALAARIPALPPATEAMSQATDDNLALFYRTLGQRQHVDTLLKTLFVQADRSGLVLNKGEYIEAYDSKANLYTYQVTLPVRGDYRSIWNFALQSLRAIPFASLDDINFRRDSISDANVEARLRFSLYLNGNPMQGRK